MRAFLYTWGAGTALYLLLAGSTEGPEIAAGVLSSLLIAGFLHRLRQTYTHAYRVPPKGAAAWFAAIAEEALSDSGRVLFWLFRAMIRKREIRGAFSRKAYQPRRDLRQSRVALTVAGMTLPPNSVVLDYHEADQELLIHRLAGEHRKTEGL